MPMTCKVCRHPDRREIDRRLLERAESFQTIASDIGLSSTSLQRHRVACIPAQLVKAKEHVEISSAAGLVERLKELGGITRQILARAIAEKKSDIALKAIARLEKQTELEARLIGELHEATGRPSQVTVVYSQKTLVAADQPKALTASSEI